MSKNEKRLIDANELLEKHTCDVYGAYDDSCMVQAVFVPYIKGAPTIDAVEVEKYEALVEMYHDLREKFVDYVCSGVPNPAPYCLNKCEGCVDRHGWCKNDSDKCQCFNPAEVVLDEERKPKSGAKMDGDWK